MATNWVKDGLDAYLSLTGEKRAQDKADSDKAYQQQSMQIQQNQDARAATSAGLTNQLSGLQIEEGTRKAADVKKTQNAIKDFITMKTASDPSIPNTLDPAEIAASRQMATDLAHTGTALDSTPPGAYELPIDKLPASAQKVFMEGPGKAALARVGNKHVEPGTNREYVITGAGPVRVVREEGKPAIITPTLLAKYSDDGSLKEVPFTDGTNSPDVSIKQITGGALKERAGITLAALDQAEKQGISPAVAYSDNLLKMVSSLPYEEQKAWLNGEVSKETARRERHVADAEVAKVAEPIAKQIEALKGTPEEKRAATVQLMLGAPSAVVDHLLKTSKSVHEMFPDAKKTFTPVETANGVYMVDATNPDNKTRIGGLKPTKDGTGGAGEKEWALLQKKAAALVRAGKYENEDQAMADLLQPDKKGADSEIYKATLKTLMDGNEKELNPKKKMTLEEMIQKANEAADSRPKGRGATPKPSALPQKRSLSSFSTGSTGAEAPLSQRLGLTF
jgi:hypothetical protein